MTYQTITSQSYLDDAIVAEKLAAEDFSVMVSPVFEFGGKSIRVVIDGHHSFAAAKLAGAEPDYCTADATECDRVALIERGEYDDFMELSWVDSDWRDINTGVFVW